MRRVPKSPRKKRKPLPPVERGAPIISQRVPRYAIRWDRVYDWAIDAVAAMDVSIAPTRNPRIETIRGQLVADLTDDEEAYARAMPLEEIEISQGPTGAVGGRRRVMIRLLTWIPDTTGGIAYSPQWIVAGHGMSAHAASAALARYIRSYALAVSKGIESRRLIVTAMDVVFWTASEGTDYV